MKRNPPSLATARTALVINQFATPGLGSLMAGRYLAGSIQLLLALAGFTLIVAWFFMVLKAAYAIMETVEEPSPPHYLGWMGLASFLSAWCLAWFTSLSVLRDARRAHDRQWQRTASPPVIDGPAGNGPHK